MFVGTCVYPLINLLERPPPPQALAHYTAPETDDALFLRLQDRLVKDYSNDLLSQPYQLAMAETNVLLVAPYSTRVCLCVRLMFAPLHTYNNPSNQPFHQNGQDKLEAAKAITPARLRAFLPRLFDRCVHVCIHIGSNQPLVLVHRDTMND